MPKITLTVDQIIEAAGVQESFGQYNIKVADFMRVNLPKDIEVSVSEDQVGADTDGLRTALNAASKTEGDTPSEEESVETVDEVEKEAAESAPSSQTDSAETSVGAGAAGTENTTAAE